MPSAPPSSADSRNTPNAIAGSINVVSATVRSVNQDAPPSMSEGICNIRQSCETEMALETMGADICDAGALRCAVHDQAWPTVTFPCLILCCDDAVLLLPFCFQH